MATAIAGPRRTKQAPAPPVQAAQPAQAQPARQLPPLDYDEPTRSARPASPTPIVTIPAKRSRVHRLRWFVLGIAFGAMGAVFARGDAAQTLRGLRVWSAKALRSLERTAPPPAKVQPSTAAPSAKPMAMAIEAPCPMNPGPGDPCAELLAPFVDPPRPSVPTVSIDALPRVKPPVVVARHRRHVTPAAAAPASSVADAPQDPPADDDSDVDPAQAPPPGPSETATPDTPGSQITTAENDPPPTR